MAKDEPKSEAAAPESAPRPVAELEELRKKAAQAEEYLDLAKRAKADFINYQDRVRREKELLSKYAVESFLLDLLPALDSMDHSVRTLEAAGDARTVLEGVRLIEKEFLRILSKHGVTPMEMEGKSFDPSYHEAVAMEETAEHPENAILVVARRGWMIHGRVLRPASVRVARRPVSGDGQESPPSEPAP